MISATVENTVERLLEDRLEQLEHARSTGAKVVGYLPGWYVPEELIWAAGAIPLCLSHGGDARAVDEGSSLLPSVMCPFVRAQIGELWLGTNSFYRSLDLLVVPATCQHLKKIGDIWECYRDSPVFKLGVPYEQRSDFEIDYYRDRLAALKNKLESITGAVITAEKLSEAVRLYDRMRELLQTLSVTRRSPGTPALSALEFARLNHASLYIDPADMVAALEEICAELRAQGAAGDAASEAAAPGAPTPGRSGRPRVLLMGPNLALGDYEVLEMAAAAGADIVIEDIYEGIRDYRHRVGPLDGGEPGLAAAAGVPGAAGAAGAPRAAGAAAAAMRDPLDSLARAYLLNRRPAAFMRASSRRRLQYALDLIRGFDVAGVLWYELQCCEFYDQESYFFQKELTERGIPMLIVESNYHGLDTGPLKTRLDAFVETMTGGLLDA